MNSQEMLAEYRTMAAQGGNFRGLTVLNHAKQIAKLARKVGAKTLLDYGSGAGDAYRAPTKFHKQLGIARQNATLYDPSFPQHSGKPLGKFDLVICSDVLEHVPEEEVDAFVSTLFGHAQSAVWASVCCRLAKKAFVDGSNLHCTVRPFQWWQDTFAEHAGAVPYMLVETA